MKLSTTMTTSKTVYVLEEADHQNVRMRAEYRAAGSVFIPDRLRVIHQEWNNGVKKESSFSIELSGAILKKDGSPHATNRGSQTFGGLNKLTLDDLPERFQLYVTITEFEGEQS